MGRLGRVLAKKNGFFPEDVEEEEEGLSVDGVRSNGMICLSFTFLFPTGEEVPECGDDDAVTNPILDV